MKKKKRPKDVADQALVERYAEFIQKHGRDWSLVGDPKRRKRLLKEFGADVAQLDEHLIRRANIEFDLKFRENIRQYNLSKKRLKDRAPMTFNGSFCLEMGDVPYIKLEGWDAYQGMKKPEVKKVEVEQPKLKPSQRKVLATMTDKWQTSDRVVKITKLPKPKVVKALKLLVTQGKAEKRKKDDGTFQYRLIKETV